MYDILIKRIYDDFTEENEYRILVDRLWPRGVSKEKAKLDEWPKELAPSNELRKKVYNKEISWDEFDLEYRKELENNKGLELWENKFHEILKSKNIYFLTSAKLNPKGHPYILKEFILKNFS